MNRSSRALFFAAVISSVVPGAAAQSQHTAQGFPERPMRYIVPFPPGGSTDIVARIVAAALTESLGQSVVIDNRGGAGGTVGAEIAAHATPDGYTIFACNVASLAVSPALYKKLGYDPVAGFAPIGLIGSTANAIVLHPGVPAKTIAQFIALGTEGYRANLFAFLEEVVPVAEAAGVRMAIHPDDPPFSLFGLPRVVSTAEDARALMAHVPSDSNGLTLCAGSFGARADNDLTAMAREFGPRIHFVHLRNIRREANDRLKALGKEKKVSEDEERRVHDQIQKVTDRFIAREFERTIPDAKLVVIPGCGHVSNLERPEEFNRTIREFCRAHPPG